MANKTEHVWIVEVKFAERTAWEPTVGCALSKLEGLVKMRDWAKNCPDDQFRITRYNATKETNDDN